MQKTPLAFPVAKAINLFMEFGGNLGLATTISGKCAMTPTVAKDCAEYGNAG